ncbi:MAG: hypothetical protein HYR63_11420 [Proteobacteria bacterium]|nr:hypothetical protein [Pseudomonadota bacterium]
MTKNVRLETVIEVFSVDNKVSGQITVEDLPTYFDSSAQLLDDLSVLRRLAVMASFDVYTMRIQLRRLGIAVTSTEHLQLSNAKKQKLVEFMRVFTLPLIQKVYGGGDHKITDFDQLVGLFSHPDRTEALHNLQILAQRMRIGLAEIPTFLEEYGDVFLSMAYYRSIFEHIKPKLTDFVAWTRETAEGSRFRVDTGFQQKCEEMLDALDRIGKATSGLLDSFDATAKVFWDDINMNAFGDLRDAVTRQHDIIGGILCGLDVKTLTWQEQFVGRRTSLEKRANFILSDMMPGLDTIMRLASLHPRPSVEPPPAPIVSG